MTKVDKAGILLGLLSILVAILAWLFPVSGSSKITLNINNQAADKYESVQTVESQNNRNLPVTSIQGYQPPSEEKPIHKDLVKSLSFKVFSSQFSSYSSDYHKLEYVSDTKHLLEKTVSFSQLNKLMSQIQSEYSKVKLIKMLRSKLDIPTEKDLETLQSQFLSAYIRSKALNLIYQ